MTAMLLSAGSDPGSFSDPVSRGVVIKSKTYCLLQAQAKRWIKELECAKKYFQAIFDNDVLENLLCSFIFVESYLAKVIDWSKNPLQ